MADPVGGRPQFRRRRTLWIATAGVLIVVVAAVVRVRATVGNPSVAAATLAPAHDTVHTALVSPVEMDSADAAVRQAVLHRTVPGATVIIGQGSRVLQSAGYGRVGWSAHDAPASPDSTLYDLASLTKAVATTTAVLLLVQDGKIHLDEPVQRSLPEFTGKWKDRVTWRQLLTHTSGLPPGARMSGATPTARLNSLLHTALNAKPGVYVQYSDLSFITLWAAAQHVAGEPLPTFLAHRVWGPLDMRSTVFWPGDGCTACAPTLVLKSGKPYRGKPSDPIAHALGIPSGNAGLFSTAHDLGRFAAMIANGGSLDGVRILSTNLVDSLFAQIPHAGHRTLGWEAFCPTEKPTQQQACRVPIAYGHTGYTGTSLWIDPVHHVWVVILSNRSYEVRHLPSLGDLRAAVFQAIRGR